MLESKHQEKTNSSIDWKVVYHNPDSMKYTQHQCDFDEIWFKTWQYGQDSSS